MHSSDIEQETHTRWFHGSKIDHKQDRQAWHWRWGPQGTPRRGLVLLRPLKWVEKTKIANPSRFYLPPLVSVEGTASGRWTCASCIETNKVFSESLVAPNLKAYSTALRHSRRWSFCPKFWQRRWTMATRSAWRGVGWHGLGSSLAPKMVSSAPGLPFLSTADLQRCEGSEPATTAADGHGRCGAEGMRCKWGAHWV